jgi:hypothetical protein
VMTPKSLSTTTEDCAMGWGKGAVPATMSVCTRCQEPLDDGQKVCACGAATIHMSFTERTAYEVEQYKAWKERQSA